MSRNFDDWLKTMKDSIATFDYYTDFEKVYKKIKSIKNELNLLNSLVGSKNIRGDFLALYNQHPQILKAIPILIAKRESQIKVIDKDTERIFDFQKPNQTPDEYANFMEQTGLFELISNRITGNLFDYVMGVEVGMDTNTRKNRTGAIMEALVEYFLVQSGFPYYRQMNKSEIEEKFNIDLSGLSNSEKAEKRFDFVFLKDGQIYACECNFYSSSGSKLNETARSYKQLASDISNIPNFNFVWITDGIGWISAKNNLEDTFDELENMINGYVFNLNDLKNDALKLLPKSKN